MNAASKSLSWERNLVHVINVLANRSILNRITGECSRSTREVGRECLFDLAGEGFLGEINYPEADGLQLTGYCGNPEFIDQGGTGLALSLSSKN